MSLSAAAPQKTTTLRLRRIRFKSGGEIRVLAPRRNCVTDRFIGTAEHVKSDKDVGRNMAGYALVVWSSNGFVHIDWENSGTAVLTPDIPRMVSDALLTEIVKTWGNRDD